MVPFAGYEMPVQYPLGILKEHLHTREQAGLFDVSHMGQAFLIGRRSRTTTARARSRRWSPPTSSTSKPGQQRYTPAAQRRRRHHRRPDGDAPRLGRRRRPAVCWSSTPRARTSTTRTSPAACRPSVKLVAAPERALLALQGPAAARRAGAALPRGAASSRFMQARPAPASAASTATSRARATPARTASRSRSPADDAGRPCAAAAGRRRACSRSASAPATRCGSRPASASTATTSTRPRARSRPASLVDPEAPPHRGRLPRRRAHPGRARQRPQAPPRRHQARGPRARARGHRDPVAAGERIGIVTSGGFGPSVNGPVAMGYVDGRARRARHARQPHGARQAAARRRRAAAVRPAPLRPQDLTRGRLHGDQRFTKDHEWIRVDGGIATVGITDYAQEQLGDIVFVELPEVGRKVSAGRGGGRGRERQGRERRVRAGLGRGRRGQRRHRRPAGARQRGRRGQGLVLQDQGRRPGRARRADGPRRLRGLRQGERPDALSAAHRRRPPRHAGQDRRRRHRRAVRRRAQDKLLDEPRRPARGPGRDGGRARRWAGSPRSNTAGGLGAVLRRRRRLQAPRAGHRRSPDPALRVPDLLHALSARDRPGHAAIPVRVPDPGRAC